MATKITGLCFHGELGVQPIAAIPDGLESVPQADGTYPIINGARVIGHSETGHHHVVGANTSELFRDPENPWVCYLQMASDDVLTHLRQTHQHAPLGLLGGQSYKIIHQRETDIRGWERRALD